MSAQVEERSSDDTSVPGEEPAPLPGPVLVCEGAEQAPRWRPGERLHHLFEDWCDRERERGPAVLAVDAGDVRLTWDELDARANQLARHLLTRGVVPGQRIALLFDDAVHTYVAMLAVLKADAAYVPLDVSFPADRVAYIVEDAGVGLVLSLSHLRDRSPALDVAFLCVDEVATLVDAESPHRLTGVGRPGPADDLCYIIYTSGSTGRPKGVAVDHASICNFVRVAAEVYGIQPGDRMYQGMTIAFDFSMEEIWVPWAAGATLVPKPGGAALLGHDLETFLVDRGVTALCCVPTLLASLEHDVPGLRFLLVSGEACPRDLVTRWHRPGRRFLNVYGPTEATVTATWSVLDPARPVTLGVPLPTYAVVILDPSEGRARPRGELGEIGITGIGLARGYVNRDDLTARAFIPDFLGVPHNPSGRIYRTGDLGRITEDGELEYHGRIDTQVKVRGYRIELTEIESVLLQMPGVAQAVVDVHEPQPGVVELAAYYTARSGEEVDEDALHRHLRAHVPPYMVPAYLERLDVIPMLPSDKADRKRLPPPVRRWRTTGGGALVGPRDETERVLADALGTVLHIEEVPVDQHFFDDLGASSLLMAQFCARLRERDGLPDISMRDVYLHPTIQDLAGAVRGAAAAAPAVVPAAPAGAPVGARTVQYVACGAAQLALFLAYTLTTAMIGLAVFQSIIAAPDLLETWRRSVVYGSGLFLALCVAPILAKWLLVGRWREEEFPIWGLRYLRFWTVKTLIRSSPMVVFTGSPLYSMYLRALGAKVGRGAVVFSGSVPVCTDLLTIGEGTVICKDVSFSGYRAVAGRIQTGRVDLGSGVHVGDAAVLDIGCALGDGASLAHASSLHTSQRVPAGERWHGSPAVPAGPDPRRVPAVPCGRLRRLTYSALQVLASLGLFFPVFIAVVEVVITDVIPVEDFHADGAFYLELLALTFLLFFGGTLLTLAVVLTVSRLFNLLLEPDAVYPLYGIRYAAQRMVARLTNLSFYMELTGDSSLIVYYLRLLGYKMPDVQQTGSNFGVALKHENPFQAIVGSGTMVSDGLSIVNADFSATSFRVSPTSVGAHSFFGNNIVYPTGGRTGDDCLLATKVMVPVDGPVREGVGLLGSPPFEIPRSVQRDHAFDELRSPDEIRRRLPAKNWHNGVTIAAFLLSRWFYLFATLLLASFPVALYGELATPPVAVALVLVLLFNVSYFVVLERAARGFRPLQPLFCSIYELPFWRHERFWKLSATAYLEFFNGTPFKGLIWRLLGVQLGRRLYDDGCAIPEKTLVTIGDDCTLNALGTIQCHSMEDGAFKLEGIRIGSGVTIGINAFIHYGTAVGDGAVVDADAFLMKGEEVGASTRWHGNPARPVTAAPGPVAEGPERWRALLDDLRAAGEPGLAPTSGVTLTLCRLDACARHEAELLPLLSAGERGEAAAMRSEDRRRDFVAGRAALRLVLSVERNPAVPPGSWRLGRTALGKPRVLGPEGLGLDVSISHGGDLVAVAVSERYDVGVDVEAVTEGVVAPGMSAAVLTAAERSQLAALPAEAHSREVVRRWTLKEAFAKCTGDGAHGDLVGLETALAPLDVTDPARPAARTWVHQEDLLLEGAAHVVAVVAGPREGAPPQNRTARRARSSPQAAWRR